MVMLRVHELVAEKKARMEQGLKELKDSPFVDEQAQVKVRSIERNLRVLVLAGEAKDKDRQAVARTNIRNAFCAILGRKEFPNKVKVKVKSLEVEFEDLVTLYIVIRLGEPRKGTLGWDSLAKVIEREAV
ncbi:hypothetical protein [Bacillus cereus]|uniref:hypothetical protein n=1 Tax=Bacillus cereus TaxID=1396 RepID=UPI000BFD91AA|nr:hypothetical protein [Bacillus cereus]PGR83681.1 hypothetical protein COC63_06755 [Bacillus cereus]